MVKEHHGQDRNDPQDNIDINDREKTKIANLRMMKHIGRIGSDNLAP